MISEVNDTTTKEKKMIYTLFELQLTLRLSGKVPASKCLKITQGIIVRGKVIKKNTVDDGTIFQLQLTVQIPGKVTVSECFKITQGII